MFGLVSIVIIIASLVAIWSPRTSWYLQEGWKYKNVEPSDAALALVRIGGIVFLIVSQSILRN
jgi:hypothetical protein